MNRSVELLRREHGFSENCTYDFALYRLYVRKCDSWRGISPTYSFIDSNPEPPIFACKFAHCPNYNYILALASEDGQIAIQNVKNKNEDSEERSIEGQQCHNNAIFNIEWDPAQMKLVSVSGDNTARLWDLTGTDLRLNRIFKGHTRSVKTAAFRKNDSAVFATGGRDGAILIWDTRAIHNLYSIPRADNCIFNGHFSSSNSLQNRRGRIKPNIKLSSITSLVFKDDNNLISCCANDGIIKIWDLRRNYTTFKGEPFPKYSIPHTGPSTFKGFTNLLVDKAGNKLYASCMDNTIYCYNLSSYSSKPLNTYTGHNNGTFYINSSLSADENYLISGSSDEKAYIWNVKNSLPLVTLNGHMVEVTCVSWSDIPETCIVTCSDDSRHKIWYIGPESSQNEIPDCEGHAYPYEGIANQDQQNRFHNTFQISNFNRIAEKRTFSDISENSTCESNHKKKHCAASAVSLKLNNGIHYLNSPHAEANSTTVNFETKQPLSLSSNSQFQSDSKMLKLALSPTLNLPNYALNGEAPHLHIMSPKREKESSTDWLTKIRKKKLLLARKGLTETFKQQQQDTKEFAKHTQETIPFKESTSSSTNSPSLFFASERENITNLNSCISNYSETTVTHQKNVSSTRTS